MKTLHLTPLLPEVRAGVSHFHRVPGQTGPAGKTTGELETEARVLLSLRFRDSLKPSKVSVFQAGPCRSCSSLITGWMDG